MLNFSLYRYSIKVDSMSDYLSIKVEKKEGTDNTFEITIHENSPLKFIPAYKGVSTEDTLLNIIHTAQQKAHDHIINTTY